MTPVTADKTRHIVAIDAGGTFFKSAVVSSKGDILEGSKDKVRVDSDGDSESILDSYGAVVRRALEKSQCAGVEVDGIGISTPGPFDYKNGVSHMTHKFKSIVGIPLRAEIMNRCSINGIPICFVHDANAFVQGEFWKGAAMGFSNVAGITIGTGTGFGVIQNGVLMTNETGGPFYTVYKRPYKGGILEDAVSRRGMIALYQRLSGRVGDNSFDVIDIERFALSGSDQNACETFEQTGRILAENLAPVLEELSVECFVLGGQIAKGYKLMAAEIEFGLRFVKCLKKVTMGADVDNSALLGAACEVVNQLSTEE